MLVPALVALVVGLGFGAWWFLRRGRAALVAAVAWLLYAPYEYLMHARVLCSGECNIRVDLLLLWPLLLAASLAVPIAFLARRYRERAAPPR